MLCLEESNQSQRLLQEFSNWKSMNTFRTKVIVITIVRDIDGISAVKTDQCPNVPKNIIDRLKQ